VPNQSRDIWTKGETLTARRYSGKAKQTTFNCLCTQLPFYSNNKPIVLHWEEVKQRELWSGQITATT